MMESIVIQTPIGPLRIESAHGRLVRIEFGAPPGLVATPRGPGVLREACRQLDEYFSGARREFDLPLDPVGTQFQRRVWDALLEVPYGSTASYGVIARRIGNPAAVRAVGLANGRNPIPLVIPCHRIIGSDGSLTGFGGGLDRKQWLLELEGAMGGEGSLFERATSRAVRS